MPKSPTLQIFGGNVRKLREGRKLSQEDLAEEADLHRTYIGGIERGERNVGVENVVRLAEALGVPPGRLFSGL